ncbi:hypothetical protein G6K93_05935 [Agrobacterium rhizogenes]|nr:hypothetical protein [Rhizobium rhizogenes]
MQRKPVTENPTPAPEIAQPTNMPLIQALSRLAGNRQSDGSSSLVSREDRETIINSCHDLLIASRSSPTPKAAQEPAAVKALEWSEPRKPDGKESFYDHCIATSPLGEYRIEWKSWKGEGDGYGVDSTLGWVGCEYTLDAAKAAAQADYEQRIRSAISQSDPATEMAALPQDVINLVIAAREAFDIFSLQEQESTALDKALDAFSSRVPYENEPDDAAPQQEDKGE